MLYHIKLLKRIDDGECRINLTENELIERYVIPYLKGELIVINGTTVDPKKIWRIVITSSENSLDELINKIETQDKKNRSPYSIFEASAMWKAIDAVPDVTDKFINKPPGSMKTTPESNTIKHDNKKVFIVHGHDTELKNDVELFITSINLEPIVLHRQLDEGLTIIEKFEKHSEVSFAIILLTPDDIGYPEYESRTNENERKVEFRARQNVIFEFGFFVGKLGRKNVCCIYKSGVTLPSDLSGLIYKQVNKTAEEVGLSLMKELKNAGLQVKYE